MKRQFILVVIAAATIGCGKDTTAPAADAHACDFVKQAVWQAAGNKLPVPDTLMASSSWDLPAPWYLGLETTTFTPTLSAASAQSCTVVNL